MIGLVPRDKWEHRFGDFIGALGAAVGPAGPDQELIIPGLGRALPVRSGRVGLVAAMDALSLKPGARIGVPLFCCPVVFEAIMASGRTIRFIDVDPETFCLSPEDLAAKRSQVDAVLAVHMFGHMCDMGRLKDAAGGLPLIEDCAQALGSTMNGRPAGSWGAIAFFSFRSGKYISAGEGGALYSQDASVLERAAQVIGRMPAPSRANDVVHATAVYLKSILRSRPLYGLVGHSLWHAHAQRINPSEDRDIALGRIFRADMRIIRKRLPSLDSAVESQRAHAAYFSESLKMNPGMFAEEKAGWFDNRYLYPITLPSVEARDSMAARLFRRRIDTMKYLDGVARIAADRFGYRGDCPVAEGLCQRVLVIPSYYGLRTGDIERIVEAVNSAWADITQAVAG